MEQEFSNHNLRTFSKANAHSEDLTHETGISMAPPSLQLKSQSPAQLQGPEEEEEMQLKKDPVQREGMEEEEELQMKIDPFQLKRDAQPVQRQSYAGSMPAEVQGRMENTFQSDFSGVKIHANSSKAPEVGALAYTQGEEIHFAPGQYDPSTSKGQELLGHELTHVVQQRQGRVQPTTEINGLPVNDDHGLETEADQMARKALENE